MPSVIFTLQTILTMTDMAIWHVHKKKFSIYKTGHYLLYVVCRILLSAEIQIHVKKNYTDIVNIIFELKEISLVS